MTRKLVAEIAIRPATPRFAAGAGTRTSARTEETQGLRP
jgi:hypothetical protein